MPTNRKNDFLFAPPCSSELHPPPKPDLFRRKEAKTQGNGIDPDIQRHVIALDRTPPKHLNKRYQQKPLEKKKPRRSTSVEGIALPACCVTCSGQWVVHWSCEHPRVRLNEDRTQSRHWFIRDHPVARIGYRPTYSYSYAGLAYWACLLQHEGGGMATASRHALTPD